MDFVRLFYPDLADQIDPASIKEKEQEVIPDLLSGQTLRVDILREVWHEGKSKLMLILVEPQSYDDKGFEERLFRYFVALRYKHNLPVVPIAVLSYPSPKAPAPQGFYDQIDEMTQLSLTHRVVQLNQLRWQDYTQRDNPVAAAFLSQMQVGKKQKVRAKVASFSQMVDLNLNPAQLYLLSGFVDTYLRLDQTEQATFEQELDKLGKSKKEKTMEITTSWMEQGIVQGEKKGRIEGKLELVQKLLARRFGPLSAQEEARLKSLDGQQVETLGEDFLDFKEKADLLAWFDAHSVALPAS